VLGLSGTLWADEWCYTTTDDFQLISDLPATERSGLLHLLYRFEPVAEPFLPGASVTERAPLKIIVFSRRSDFTRLTGKRKFAAFMQPSLTTHRLLIGPVRGDLTDTTLHEYAHYLMRNRLDVSLPTWFDEGLASLLGSTEFNATHASLGALPVDRMTYRFTSGDELPPVRRSLESTIDATSVEHYSSKRIGVFYDWAWLLVHYLYLGDDRGEDIRAAQADVSAFLSGDASELAAHLSLSDNALVRNLRRHLKDPPILESPSPPPVVEVLAEGCLSEYERDLVLARAVLNQRPEAANRLLAPHVEARSDDVDLLVTRARIELARDREAAGTALAEQALSLDAGNPGVNVLTADLAVRDCLFTFDEDCAGRWREASGLYRAALRQAPDRFDAVLGLGLAQLYTGRPGEAVNYLRVAYRRAPWAAVTNYFLGESLRLIGDNRARGHLNNAYNWADLELWRRLAEESLKLLDHESAGAPDGGAS
jgi:tetratricopeptide (TPR) repeat protein